MNENEYVILDKFCEENNIDPFFAIAWACKQYDWVIGVEELDADDEVPGVVIGDSEWVNKLFKGSSVNQGNQ